jgi:hypothetical protein
MSGPVRVHSTEKFPAYFPTKQVEDPQTKDVKDAPDFDKFTHVSLRDVLPDPAALEARCRAADLDEDAVSPQDPLHAPDAGDALQVVLAAVTAGLAGLPRPLTVVSATESDTPLYLVAQDDWAQEFIARSRWSGEEAGQVDGYHDVTMLPFLPRWSTTGDDPVSPPAG